MAEYIELGRIAAVTGKYMKGAQEKNRYKNIGTLMQSIHSDGRRNLWIKMDADILHASLYALVRSASMKAGDDNFICSVFEPKPDDRPGNGGKSEGAPLSGSDDERLPF